jgi:hypothetical protein
MAAAVGGGAMGALPRAALRCVLKYASTRGATARAAG